MTLFIAAAALAAGILACLLLKARGNGFPGRIADRLVEDWGRAWRWFSVQAMVLSGVVQAAWDALPADLKQYLPHGLGLALSLGFLLLGIGGRLVRQRGD